MIKIRDPNLDLLAILDHVPDPQLTEAINRELSFSCSTVIDEEKSQHITSDCIVEVEGQYFQVAKLEKERTQDNELMIYLECEHVSYQLIEEELEYFTFDGTVPDMLTELFAGTPFAVGTVEVTGTQTISIQEPMTKRMILVGIAEAFDCELDYNGYEISLLQRRGADNGVHFRVGKNLRGVRKIVDNTEKDASGNPKIAYEIDMIELSQIPEYGDLEKVQLGDAVRVIDSDLGIDVTTRVVKYTYNPLLKLNSTVELSNFVEDITDTVYRVQRDTLYKERLYNGIRIGPENGFEAIRSDNKARTVMNATTGITIQKGDGSGSSWSDVFYADLDGNLVLTGRIEAGEFVGGTIDIGNGAFSVDNTGNVTITTGSIDLGNGVFTVDNAGNMSATSAYIEGTIVVSNTSGTIVINPDDGFVSYDDIDNARIVIDINGGQWGASSPASIDFVEGSLWYGTIGSNSLGNMYFTADSRIEIKSNYADITLNADDIYIGTSSAQTLTIRSHVEFTGGVTGLSTDTTGSHRHQYTYQKADGTWVDAYTSYAGDHSHSIT